MHERFPDATEEDLERSDRICIICREHLTSAKKLACGHMFHFHCLRSWLERQQTCPTCRAPIAPAEPTPPPAAEPPTPDAVPPAAGAAAPMLPVMDPGAWPADGGLQGVQGLQGLPWQLRDPSPCLGAVSLRGPLAGEGPWA